LLPNLEEFAHAGLEDAGERTVIARLVLNLLIKLAEIAVTPELGLELIGRNSCRAQREELAEDDGPRGDRNRKKQCHDKLHQCARLLYERQDRHV